MKWNISSASYIQLSPFIMFYLEVKGKVAQGHNTVPPLSVELATPSMIVTFPGHIH